MVGYVVMVKDRCILIPAIKKNAVIPDQLVKKLAGTTLIERALNTARACVASNDVITLTDSEEIALICERAGTRCSLNSAWRFHGEEIVCEMREFLSSLAQDYKCCIILEPAAPLVTWVDVENAWKKFHSQGADSLVTVKRARQRLWSRKENNLDALLMDASGDNEGAREVLLESRAISILNLRKLVLHKTDSPKIVPFFLEERGLEIENYQDWWICEKLLARRHIVFVVAGYPAIGLGHVYRALMLAHEINDHKITFVCTRESELAAENVAARDYQVIRQQEKPLSETVLAIHPDLVVNDFLNTGAEYVGRLQKAGVRCVNFEDEGPGALIADLVINALDNKSESSARRRCGPDYFCLRDEFANAPRNDFRETVRTALLTFGGTDQHNFTVRVLNALAAICRQKNIALRIVVGPGYAHKQELEKRIQELANLKISFTWATNVMSKMMEGVDLAVCSAGRTVYELAHMRIPGIIYATHKREAGHSFGRWRNGFAFAGLMDNASEKNIQNLFCAMLDPSRRKICWQRQNRLSFAGNKERVVGLLQDQLEKAGGVK